MDSLEGYYLYCDLDGTLFDDDKCVSEEDRAAICSFVGAGGRFGVATGRVPSILRSIKQDFPVSAPCILFNGAGLYDLSTGQFLEKHSIRRDLAQRLTRRIVEVKHDACVQVFTDSGIYEINPNQKDDPQTQLEQLPIISAPMDQVCGPILKILVAYPAAELEKIVRAVRQEPYIDQLTTFTSSGSYLEIVAGGVDKGTALSDVRERCGDVKKILAIGDYYNDLNMVSLADIGGAPANAIPEVKTAADIVLKASNNESCVARFLEAALG